MTKKYHKNRGPARPRRVIDEMPDPLQRVREETRSACLEAVEKRHGRSFHPRFLYLLPAEAEAKIKAPLPVRENPKEQERNAAEVNICVGNK
jgi:hypothetical protein